MRILFIGDIFGTVGKRVLAQRLPSLLAEQRIDFCIANAENVAGGHGITHNLARKLHGLGVQVITGGNHSFASPDILDDYVKDPGLLRPHNFPPGNAGKGFGVYELPGGSAIGVINLLGRTYASEHSDCPFRAAEGLVAEMRQRTTSIVLDFHAEATSEKKSMYFFLDGKVSAVLGTHTHVQTADETVSEHGTAYITDVGMTGPEQSAIGMKPEGVIRKFILQTPVRFEPSSQGPMLNAVVIEVDDSGGRAVSITRVYERITFTSAHEPD